jgi:hypothetical protein
VAIVRTTIKPILRNVATLEWLLAYTNCKRQWHQRRLDCRSGRRQESPISVNLKILVPAKFNLSTCCFQSLTPIRRKTDISVRYSPAMNTDAQNEPNSNNATSEFDELAIAMYHNLVPEGTLEETFADEVIRAAWRLRRCANVEASLSDSGPDPMASLSTTPIQIVVDRGRTEAHRILKRSMDELRRLQNERRFRIEVLPEGFNTEELGLASYKDLMPSMAAEKRWQLLKRQLEGTGSVESMLELAIAPPAAKTEITKQTQSAPQPPEIKKADSTKRTQFAPRFISHLTSGTPRNAPCPCGSGQKHKRCCGQNAAPVLYSAAA